MGKHHGKKNHDKKADARLRYLQCKVEPGMFQNEFLVSLEGVDPDAPERSIPVQLLVDKRNVERLRGTPARGKPVAGWLRVALANIVNGLAYIVLPQPALPVGESMFVPREHVKQVAGS